MWTSLWPNAGIFAYTVTTLEMENPLFYTLEAGIFDLKLFSMGRNVQPAMATLNE